MDYRLLIARRYLLSRKRVSLISIITGISVAGVSLGVAALIVVLSVMNGFYDFVRDLLISLDPHVRIVSADERGVANPDSLEALALTLPQVTNASAYVEGKALLLHTGGADVNKVVIVRGVEQDGWNEMSEVVERTGFGSFSLGEREGTAGIVLGARLGRRLALVPGGSGEASVVGLLSAEAVETMLTQIFGRPRVRRFEVRGLYELQEVYDANHVFVDIAEAQRLFRMGSRVSGVELRLRNADRAGAVKRALRRDLSSDRYEIMTWYDLQKSLYDVMVMEKWGASLILALIVVVAAFNIVGSLTMIVIEKQRDVGALQAMGVSKKGVRTIFLLEGALVGVVGTAIGLAIGLTLSVLQKAYELVPLADPESFMIDAYPVSIHAGDVAAIAFVAIGLCIAAALYPAYRAAAVEPAQAVQIEG